MRPFVAEMVYIVGSVSRRTEPRTGADPIDADMFQFSNISAGVAERLHETLWSGLRIFLMPL